MLNVPDTGLRCSEDSHLVGTWAELAFRPESRSKAGPTAMLHRRASPRLCSKRSFRRSLLRPSIQSALEVAPTLPALPGAWAPGSGREGDALISAGAFSGSFSWMVCPGVHPSGAARGPQKSSRAPAAAARSSWFSWLLCPHPLLLCPIPSCLWRFSWKGKRLRGLVGHLAPIKSTF